MQTSRTALVLGATGGAGYEIARALRRRGWQIRALSRRPDHGRSLLPAADWLEGDAMHASDVAAAAINADLIVHAVNPPGYRNWRGLAHAGQHDRRRKGERCAHPVSGYGV
jgi:uncharacterized protein YbjT (DUF2867 family)